MASPAITDPSPIGQDSINAQLQSRLFSLLPGEIRTQIYEYLLTLPPDSEGYVAIRERCYRSTIRKNWYSVLTILQTCRLANKEAAGIFYANNKLQLEDVKTSNYEAIHFTRALSLPRANNIRYLTACVGDMFDVRSNLRALQSEGRVPNLEKLTLRFTKPRTVESLIDHVMGAKEAAREFRTSRGLELELAVDVPQWQRQSVEAALEEVAKCLPAQRERESSGESEEGVKMVGEEARWYE